MPHLSQLREARARRRRRCARQAPWHPGKCLAAAAGCRSGRGKSKLLVAHEKAPQGLLLTRLGAPEALTQEDFDVTEVAGGPQALRLAPPARWTSLPSPPLLRLRRPRGATLPSAPGLERPAQVHRSLCLGGTHADRSKDEGQNVPAGSHSQRAAADCTRATARLISKPEGSHYWSGRRLLSGSSAHSITSSARARIVGGIARPSAFAVLRFTTSSRVSGCWTGRSPGRSPFRMRTT
jgi:hypothetical protein